MQNQALGANCKKICHVDDRQIFQRSSNTLFHEKTIHDPLNEKVLKDKKNSYKKPAIIAGSIIITIVFSIIFSKSGENTKNNGGIPSQILAVDQAQNSLSS